MHRPLKLIDEPLGRINSEHTRGCRSRPELMLMERRAEVQDRVMMTGKSCFLNVEREDMMAVENLNLIDFDKS